MTEEEQQESEDLLPVDPQAVPTLLTFLGALSAIPAMFFVATLFVELANLRWGPFSETAYSTASFGCWFGFLLLAILIFGRLEKGQDEANTDAVGEELMETEPSIFQFGFARVMTFILPRMWLFLIFLVLATSGSRSLEEEGREPVVQESYFWDTLILFGKGFGTPLLVMVAISIGVGLIVKNKKAAS